LAAELRTASLAALLLSPHPQTRSFAEKTRQQDVPAGGQWSVSELLAIKADSAGGKAVFQKAACIACHVIDREGIDFGPDLSAIGTKLKPEELIAAIVEPSQTIALGFEGVVVELREGGELSGYISSESEDTLSLRLMGGLQKDIPVSTIKARQRLKTSLMPVGLNQALTRQEFADLIAWLSGHRADSVTPTSSSKR
jgi:putative heme-binding domain-containing protein